MKGEYIEDQDNHHHQHHHNNISHPIFPKFPPHQFHPHDFPPEPDSATHATTTSTKKPKTHDDGATVEVTRRPRGRPPGSKNRPKPPIVINREPEPPMAPCILEIPTGSDLIESLTRFTRRRGMGICVLTASGAVANVTLKQPSISGPCGATVTFHGRFEILSLSAVLLVETVPFWGNNDDRFGFTISLAGPQGQIVGGKVVEPLVSAGAVYVVAASFNCPSYHRLPAEDQDPVSNASLGGGDGQPGSPVSGGGSGTIGSYGCHVGSGSGNDVMWGPTSRPPLPPPPY